MKTISFFNTNISLVLFLLISQATWARSPPARTPSPSSHDHDGEHDRDGRNHTPSNHGKNDKTPSSKSPSQAPTPSPIPQMFRRFVSQRFENLLPDFEMMYAPFVDPMGSSAGPRYKKNYSMDATTEDIAATANELPCAENDDSDATNNDSCTPVATTVRYLRRNPATTQTTEKESNASEIAQEFQSFYGIPADRSSGDSSDISKNMAGVTLIATQFRILFGVEHPMQVPPPPFF